jgi:hypothetical protein
MVFGVETCMVALWFPEPEPDEFEPQAASRRRRSQGSKQSSAGFNMREREGILFIDHPSFFNRYVIGTGDVREGSPLTRYKTHSDQNTEHVAGYACTTPPPLIAEGEGTIPFPEEKPEQSRMEFLE